MGRHGGVRVLSGHIGHPKKQFPVATRVFKQKSEKLVLGDPLACRICGAPADLRYVRPSHHVWQCSACEAVFVEPIRGAALEMTMAEESQQAVDQGRQYMRTVYVDKHDFWIDYWTGKIAAIETHLGRRGTLLDIGCALGHFQLAAVRRGWTAVGVDLSQDQADYARERLGLDVRCSRFEEAGFDPASFDVITAWSVIEHVREPFEFLTKAWHYLKPNGLLVLQTPNQDSLITSLAGLSYRLSGKRYLLPVYSLDHIFRFNDRSLRTLLDAAGYRVDCIEQYDHLEVMLMRMSLQPHATARRIALTTLHAAAAATNRRNQLVAFARPMRTPRSTFPI